MKLTTTTLLTTMALFATSISAKGKVDGGDCTVAKEGEKTCKHPWTEMWGVRDSIAECRNGKWRKVEGCERAYYCHLKPEPHCVFGIEQTIPAWPGWDHVYDEPFSRPSGARPPKRPDGKRPGGKHPGDMRPGSKGKSVAGRFLMDVE